MSALRQEYQDEIDALKQKMLKAQDFAKRVPIFAEKILNYKFTGEEDWLSFGERYKSIPLAWGIKRGFYKKDGPRDMCNYRGEDYHGYFFNIYINSCNLFDDAKSNYGLYEFMKDEKVFFVDHLNSTFYIEDENIESFLDKLSDWYETASRECKNTREKERIAKLEKELAQLKSA